MAYKNTVKEVIEKMGIESAEPDKVSMFSILEKFFLDGARTVAVSRSHGCFVVTVEASTGEIFANKDDSFQNAVLNVAAKALGLGQTAKAPEEPSDEKEPSKKRAYKKRVARKG